MHGSDEPSYGETGEGGCGWAIGRRDQQTSSAGHGVGRHWRGAVVGLSTRRRSAVLVASAQVRRAHKSTTDEQVHDAVPRWPRGRGSLLALSCSVPFFRIPLSVRATAATLGGLAACATVVCAAKGGRGRRGVQLGPTHPPGTPGKRDACLHSCVSAGQSGVEVEGSMYVNTYLELNRVVGSAFSEEVGAKLSH